MSEKWTAPKGFKPVIDIYRGGYTAGFDRDQRYWFIRWGDALPSAFRLSDQSGFFNVASLYFASLEAPEEEQLRG